MYCAENFLNYLENEHCNNYKNGITDWEKFCDDIFIKFDDKLRKLKIKGGTTVIVGKLVKNVFKIRFLWCESAQIL